MSCCEQKERTKEKLRGKGMNSRTDGLAAVWEMEVVGTRRDTTLSTGRREEDDACPCGKRTKRVGAVVMGEKK